MSYCIPDEYNARISAAQDFKGESLVADLWQNEVYEKARQIADAFSYRTVLDVGSGSGFKLLKFFKEFDTVGIDLPTGIEMLKDKYPDRRWLLQSDVNFPVDLVICSDVIEHVDDPDALCNFIKSVQPKHVVISTPDKGLVCDRHGQPELGPPRNLTHVREWTYFEFEKYMASHFTVEEFFYSNKEQYTMCAVVHP